MPRKKQEDSSSLGLVVQKGEKWRTRFYLDKDLYGPLRDTAAEATADLARARELPRRKIATFLRGLTVPLAAQPMSCSDAAAGSRGEGVPQSTVGLPTSCPDPNSGKRSASDELASSPTGKKFKGDDDGGYGTPPYALAMPTPASKKQIFGDDGGLDNLGSPPQCARTTPSMATKLAQSCRKSPMVVM